MELLQLKYFQVVAKHQHLTKAANELNIAQSSLSKTISRLEKDLGYSLFNRQGRQIKLSVLGEAYLRRVDRVFLELLEGQRELEQLAQLEETLISFAVTIPSILPSLLKEFLGQYPAARLKQYQSTSADMKLQLLNGDIDIGISTVPIRGDDIEWMPIFEEEILLLVAHSHPLAARESVRLIELDKELFVSLTTGYGFRDLMDHYCKLAGFRMNIAFEGHEAGIMNHLIEMGLGIGFSPELTVVKQANPNTARLRITEPACRRTIGLAWNRRRFMPAVVQNFKRFVIHYFTRFNV
jgi:DNA-binding transcriptional LysR family regulator